MGLQIFTPVLVFCYLAFWYDSGNNIMNARVAVYLNIFQLDLKKYLIPVKTANTKIRDAGRVHIN